ncbi:uncharacterized protein LOC133174462 [Saccostrea echinata]|uniref:uncharacterized protein LOC133174462 n=1 Tax=Saccostrea echinata TaxID=191078 RepID=UPI002A7ECD49|nr:uncharacterized protein LOC133174462 [Saccostrea echinata]
MNDMVEILEYLHQFVPFSRREEELQNVEVREENSAMRTIPLGGDQLSCERVRGAHMVRLDSDTPEERLEGCMSMIEDFHEKMNFIQMLMDKFYSVDSAREVGTLYQLKCLINRRNVTKNASKDYHAIGAFVDIACEGHVIAAALTFFGMTDINSQCIRIPNGIHLADVPLKKRTLKHMIGELVDELLLNKISQSIERLENEDDATDGHGHQQDGVFNYATNFLKFSLLRKICVMATRSGDGNRVIRHWKYAMLLYHTAHKVKYRLEAFLLQAGIMALYTPRIKHQIIWNRFINLSGGKGRNLDGDYVMELLNKYAKSRVKLVNQNHSPELVKRIGKTMMFCHDVNHHLEKQIQGVPISRKHVSQDSTSDLQKVVRELQNADVFTFTPNRYHASFQHEKSDIFNDFDVKEFHKWITVKKKEYAVGKKAF